MASTPNYTQLAIQEAKKLIVTELRDIQIIKAKLTHICTTSNEIEGMISKIKKHSWSSGNHRGSNKHRGRGIGDCLWTNPFSSYIINIYSK